MAWQSDPITPRQRIAIALIEQYVGVRFTGNNKGHASAYIGDHYAQAKHLRDNQDTQHMTNREAVVSLRQRKLLQETSPWDE